MSDTCLLCWFQEHDAVKTPYPGCPCCANNHGIVIVDGEVVAPVSHEVARPS